MRIAMLCLSCSFVASAQSISVAQLELKSEQPEQSLAELWGTAAANPTSASARVNVAVALLSVNRLQQAEWAARESIDLDPAHARAQLLLGWILTRQYRYTSETLDCLHRAEKAYPEARLAAADVLSHQGQFPAARAEIDAYLASGNAPYRQTALRWLKLLTLQ